MQRGLRTTVRVVESCATKVVEGNGTVLNLDSLSHISEN